MHFGEEKVKPQRPHCLAPTSVPLAGPQTERTACAALGELPKCDPTLPSGGPTPPRLPPTRAAGRGRQPCSSPSSQLVPEALGRAVGNSGKWVEGPAPRLNKPGPSKVWREGARRAVPSPSSPWSPEVGESGRWVSSWHRPLRRTPSRVIPRGGRGAGPGGRSLCKGCEREPLARETQLVCEISSPWTCGGGGVQPRDPAAECPRAWGLEGLGEKGRVQGCAQVPPLPGAGLRAKLGDGLLPPPPPTCSLCRGETKAQSSPGGVRLQTEDGALAPVRRPTPTRLRRVPGAGRERSPAQGPAAPNCFGRCAWEAEAPRALARARLVYSRGWGVGAAPAPPGKEGVLGICGAARGSYSLWKQQRFSVC
nr:uncharacterized protein LOC111749205 [Loxodonta africana]